MKKQQERPKVNDQLDLTWDKEEQAFSERRALRKTTGAAKRDVADYLDFLKEMPPAPAESRKNRLADKQFVLL